MDYLAALPFALVGVTFTLGVLALRSHRRNLNDLNRLVLAHDQRLRDLERPHRHVQSDGTETAIARYVDTLEYRRAKGLI